MLKKKRTSFAQKMQDGLNKLLRPYVKKPKQNVSPFVKRMREIDAIPRSRLLWLSKQEGMKGNTYIKAKHGSI